MRHWKINRVIWQTTKLPSGLCKCTNRSKNKTSISFTGKSFLFLCVTSPMEWALLSRAFLQIESARWFLADNNFKTYPFFNCQFFVRLLSVFCRVFKIHYCQPQSYLAFYKIPGTIYGKRRTLCNRHRAAGFAAYRCCVVFLWPAIVCFRTYNFQTALMHWLKDFSTPVWS